MSRAKWATVPIRQLYQGLYDGPHATPKPSDSGPVFLGIKNVTEDGRLDLTEIRHIAEDDYTEWTRRVEPHSGDLVFTYEATLNRYALIPGGFRGCLGRRMALIRPDPAKVDVRFLLYYFFTEEWRTVIFHNTLSGSTVDRIPLSDFPDFPVRVPPLQLQRRIASVLSAYDELIENNQRRIQILEVMVQALYREWFVAFRFPGHKSVPVVPSRLGSIPEGWEGCFGDLAAIERFSVNPFEFPDEEFKHFSIPAYDDDRTPAIELGERIRSGKYFIDAACVLLSKLNPHIPRVWLPKPTGLQRAIASTEFLVLRPRPGIPREILYAKCCSKEFAEQFASLAIGTSTSHQRVKPDNLLAMPTSVPDQVIAGHFSSRVRSLLELSEILRVQRQNLRLTRDLLLPRLMSGQIRLDEAAV